MRFVFSKVFFGVLFLLAAALIITGQLEGVIDSFGAANVIAIIAAILVLAHCAAKGEINLLPLPVALFYFALQSPLDLPYIRPFILVLTCILAIAGLSILLPAKLRGYHYNRYIHKKFKNAKDAKDAKKAFGSSSSSSSSSSNDDFTFTVNGNEAFTAKERADNDNNPVVNAHFASHKLYLKSTALETAQFDCSFGELEVFFEDAALSSNGAEVNINCSFAKVKLHVPSHWRVVNNLSCAIGEVDVKSFSKDESVPCLLLRGNVSFGGVKVKSV
jgi:predicted membrane protein